VQRTNRGFSAADVLIVPSFSFAYFFFIPCLIVSFPMPPPVFVLLFCRVTFASGYSAGVICAVVSHPADSLVSQLGKASNKGKSIGTIAREVGFKDLMTKGLGTRIIMIGTLTGLQWYIYDTFKSAMGMGTTGGK
jgi:Mitochondrial carrier protein